MEEVERLSDRIGIIDHGQLIAEGSLNELKEQLQMEETLVIKPEIPINSNTFNSILSDFPKAIHQENQVLVSSKNSNADLARLFKAFEKLQVHVSSIEIQKVNLEMIFLKLTGNKLRD